MSAMSLRNRRPSRNPGVWLRQAGDENAVYNPETRSVYLLNDTALAIWQLCDGNTEVHEMVTAVCDLCNMHPDIVVEDVERILSDFELANLISWTES
ncbi:MAG: PqqD family protein [Actinomycetota bacterium]